MRICSITERVRVQRACVSQIAYAMELLTVLHVVMWSSEKGFVTEYE
jgi:hypothetical protein